MSPRELGSSRTRNVRRRPAVVRAGFVILPLGLVAVLVLAFVAQGLSGTPSGRSTAAQPSVSDSATPSPGATAVGPLAPTPRTTQDSPTAEPATRPTSSGSTTTATVGCNDVQARGAQALSLLRHRAALRQVRVQFAAGRTGLLADARSRERLVTVYVRDCRQEPVRQIAAALVDQAAQVTEEVAWSAADRRSWLRARAIAAPWSTDAVADVGSVAVVWQLGTTSYWRSRWSPPRTVTDALTTLLSR